MPKDNNKPREVTRQIKVTVQNRLWGRAAGRCQFSGCNLPLYKSPVTQEDVNIAEKAHIYSFSKNGPRGWGIFKTAPKDLNNLENLLLVCHSCHEKIDQDLLGERYSADLLKQWKQEHEVRVFMVTDIDVNKRSHVLLYGSRIGDELSPLQKEATIGAMFPDWYPAEERPVNLSMKSSHDDSTPEFWSVEASHLAKEFDRQVRLRVEEAKPNHFSVFAMASQPLLVLLGSLLTDKVPVLTYQLHRSPKTWHWQPHPQGFSYRAIEPLAKEGQPVLVLSLSARIAHERIQAVLGDAVSIWELTIDECHNDFLKSKEQLDMFALAVRKLMVRIMQEHPQAKSLSIFPAIPLACAVELGRARMPKADLLWEIYDQNHKHNKFIQTLTIGATT